ncbi:hypothetical protein [uncultured Schumannella sp.]|uniref:hypothetical protein n=1 Tax=uncultured Schumannella sp. TaxID=1195956 RepID=UPI0025E9A145|nr:hypothetical protein [uncultured Schumannella sp.]
MTRTPADKLQIKPETELLLDPSTPEQRDKLVSLPERVTLVGGIGRNTEGDLDRQRIAGIVSEPEPPRVDPLTELSRR